MALFYAADARVAGDTRSAHPVLGDGTFSVRMIRKSVPSLTLQRRLYPWILGVALVALGSCVAQPRTAPEPRAPADGSSVRANDRVYSGPPTQAEITPGDLKTRLYIFADDSMGGRAAGTPDNLRGTAYIEREVRRLGLEPAGDNGTYFQNVPLVTSESITNGTGARAARNVVAILRGGDEKMRGRYIAIGAHNDHDPVEEPIDHDSVRAFNIVARPGGAESPDVEPTPQEWARIKAIRDSLRRIRPSRLDSIMNGADDDGSGSMAVLEIAEALVKSNVRPKRSILFVWHTAEELGLLGSAYFTDHATVPRESIVAQLNIDRRSPRGEWPAGLWKFDVCPAYRVTPIEHRARQHRRGSEPHPGDAVDAGLRARCRRRAAPVLLQERSLYVCPLRHTDNILFRRRACGLSPGD